MFYRALVPVAITKPMTDSSSMALVQYGVNISPVRPKFVIPKTGIPINTMKIDNGKGWAHNKLQKFVGEARATRLDGMTGTKAFKKMTDEIIQDGVIMDQFKYDKMSDKISLQMSKGRQQGIRQFLDWIDGRKTIPGPDGKKIEVSHVINQKDYIDFIQSFAEGSPIESDIYETPVRSISPGTQSINESVRF